mgnify:FL=1
MNFGGRLMDVSSVIQLKVDFNEKTDMSFTRPTKLVVCNHDIKIEKSWISLYIKLVYILYSIYPEKIPEGMSFDGDGKIDFSNRSKISSMKSPMRIYKGLFLETALSTTKIVSKIKALLDICNLDYSDVIIFYEKKDDIDYVFEDKKSPSSNEFFLFLRDKLYLSDSKCKNYITAINRAENFASTNKLKTSKIYNCYFEDASNTMQILMKNNVFLRSNSKKHNLYKDAFDLFSQCMNYMDKKPYRIPLNCNSTEKKAEYVSDAYDSEENDISPEKTDVNPFESVLEKSFQNGFRLNSIIDTKKFKRSYEELTCSSLDLDSKEIEIKAKEYGFVYDGKLYPVKTILSDKLKQKLHKYIDDSFDSGKTSIYFEALFNEFSDEFLDYNINSPDMLRSYIVFEHGNEYKIDEKQISKKNSVIKNPVDEVRSCLKNHGGLMSKDEIYSALSNLPQKKIDTILWTNYEFVNNGKNEFFDADLIDVSNEQLKSISTLISDTIKSHGFMSGTELVNDFKRKFPKLYEEYSFYSDKGLRDSLKYKLEGRFVFNGNIISDKNLSSSDILNLFVSNRETITLDELESFVSEMNSGINFELIFKYLFRIDEKTFISKNRASFNVDKTDQTIDLFCQNEYIPISSIQNFAMFPDAGFSWNKYLLESYIFLFSKKYCLLNRGFNRNSAIGVIVKKSSGYESFNDLIEDELANSNIELNKETALDYLVDKGYLARRSFSDLEELLGFARAKRNSNKGRF